MRTLYIDCGMGAAGDMLAAALLELCDDQEETLTRLNGLGIPHTHFAAEQAEKKGITGTHLKVEVHGQEELDHHHDHHHHHHSSMDQIDHILSHMHLSEKVEKDVRGVYALLAQAESKVHGVPVSQIHFHEVGDLDAVADITAVCYLLDVLKPEKIVASAVHTGCGQVKCAHGILPVPAPATMELLRDVPVYGGEIQGELCTPTGAALLKYFVKEFGAMPVMAAEKIGYGMGKKDFPRANCVRMLLGNTQGSTDTVWELACNLDDMTGEELGFALEQMFTQGALDAYTAPITMKKSRPGVIFTVLCREEDREKLVKAMFCHTTTLGIRQTAHYRCTLDRACKEVDTPYGTVRIKTASGYGVTREKYEYEDIAKIAKEQDLSLRELKNKLS